VVVSDDYKPVPDQDAYHGSGEASQQSEYWVRVLGLGLELLRDGQCTYWAVCGMGVSPSLASNLDLLPLRDVCLTALTGVHGVASVAL
jgi:hypothetical protein